MKIYGVDFTSSPGNKKKLHCIGGRFNDNATVFEVDTLRTWTTLPGLQDWLQGETGPFVIGFDFPFGLPLEYLADKMKPSQWEAYVKELPADKIEFKNLIRGDQQRRKHGQKYLWRLTDSIHNAVSPLNVVNPPVGMMFYEGAKILLETGLSVIPCQPRESNRVAVETYPAILARWFPHGKYKEDSPNDEEDDKLKEARRKILSGLLDARLESHFAFRLQVAEPLLDAMREDGTGDTLDSFLCAVQAAWAFKQGESYGIPYYWDAERIKLEGWIVSPPHPMAKPGRPANGRSQVAPDKLMKQIRLMSYIGRSLSSEPNIDVMTEMIIDRAREFTHADGGTLYIIEDGALHFKVVQNDTLKIRMGGTSGVPITFPPVAMKQSNVSAYAAMTGNLVNIPDVYQYEPFDFTGPKKFDLAMKYRTQSMLVVPMKGPSNTVIGVMQLLNARDPENPKVTIPFAADYESLIESLASQAAVAITNAMLMAEANQRNAELIIARDQALEASRAKSRFLATMSHELRTPMNAIIGYSEMLQEEALENNQTSYLEDLQKITSSGKYLLGLINDILDLSKIESGKMEIKLDHFNIPVMVNDIVSTIEPLVGRNQNKLCIDCPDSAGSMFADQTRVRQMIINLLGNACKFTSNGTISLIVRRDLVEHTTWIRFEIVDSGIGMSPEKLKQLFVEFNQGGAEVTQKYGGSGLGLAISRRFCRMMGGDITVTSELGKGSTFTIKLPAEVVAAVKHPLRRASDGTRGAR